MLDALRLCTQASLLPETLKALSGIAVIWGKNGQREPAYELLYFVFSHSACNQETYEFRGDFMETLSEQLPDSTRREAARRGLTRDPDLTASNILLKSTLD